RRPSEIYIAYRRSQTLQAHHLLLPIGIVLATGGRMRHFVDEDFLHSATASVVSQKSDKDLATHEIDEACRVANGRGERRISTSLGLPVPHVVNHQNLVVG